MPTLAPKLPYTHPFAGGYPRVGGQPLPSDPDAIDYLERVAAADGAAVEVGVAVAVDSLVKGLKEDGLWNAIGASCLLCGPRTLAGALVPLRGDAPTSYNFASGDYSRSLGLVGRPAGSTYLNSNISPTTIGGLDMHGTVYVQSVGTLPNTFFAAPNFYVRAEAADTSFRANLSNTKSFGQVVSAPTFVGISRLDGVTSTRANSASADVDTLALSESASNVTVLETSDARLAFYSIGSALDLAALDTHISRYVAAVQFWSNTGLAAAGYDDATIDYVNRAYSNGGTL